MISNIVLWQIQVQLLYFSFFFGHRSSGHFWDGLSPLLLHLFTAMWMEIFRAMSGRCGSLVLHIQTYFGFDGVSVTIQVLNLLHHSHIDPLK